MPKPKKKSRQLNTYAKPKLVKQQVKFPYSRYKIDWCDIVTEGGWGSEKEFSNMKLATCNQMNFSPPANLIETAYIISEKS